MRIDLGIERKDLGIQLPPEKETSAELSFLASIAYRIFCRESASSHSYGYVERQVVNVIYDIRVNRTLIVDNFSAAKASSARNDYVQEMVSLGLSKKRATELVRHALQDAEKMPPTALARKLVAKFFPGGVN